MSSIKKHAVLPTDGIDDKIRFYLCKEQIYRKFHKIDLIQSPDFWFALVITGRLYYTFRLYWYYSFTVEKDSSLYRALTEGNEPEYFNYSAKNIKEDGITYDIVEELSKEKFRTKEKALDYVEKLKIEWQQKARELDCRFPRKKFPLKHLQYCKKEIINFCDERIKILKEYPEVVEVRNLQDKEYQEVYNALLEDLKERLNAEKCSMTTCLDVVLFRFLDSYVTFFLVRYTLFSISWSDKDKEKASLGEVNLYESHEVKIEEVLLIKDTEGKVSFVSRMIGDSSSLRNFLKKDWGNAILDVDNFFISITTKTSYIVDHMERIGEFVKLGSIIMTEKNADTVVAVYIGNGEVLRVLNKEEIANENVVYKRERIEEFMNGYKEFRAIEFRIRTYNIEEIIERAISFNGEDMKKFEECSRDKNAMYLVTGVRSVFEERKPMGFFSRKGDKIYMG